MFFIALLITIFSDICKIQSLLPALSAIMFQKIIVIVPTIGLFTNPQLIKNIKRTFSSTRGRVLIFLVVWMVLSVPFSMYPGASFRFLTEHLWKFLLITCLIIAYGYSKESVDKMIWSFIFAVAIFGVAAFISKGGERFSAITEYDPNENALLFVLAIPFIFWKMMALKGLKKILMACLLCLVVIGIVQTQSRGGFLGLIAVAAVSMYQYRHIGKVNIVKIAAIAAVLVGILYFVGGEGYEKRILTMFDSEVEYNYTSESGRLEIWKEGLALMIDNPFLGVGVDAFIAAIGFTFKQESGKWKAAHNSFIQVGTELGFPGIIAYCFIIISTMRGLQKIASARDVSNKKLNFASITAYSLIGSWIGFIVSGSLLSVAYSNLVFFLISTSWAFLNAANTSPERKEVDLLSKAGKESVPVSQQADLTTDNRRKNGRNRYSHN